LSARLLPAGLSRQRIHNPDTADRLIFDGELAGDTPGRMGIIVIDSALKFPYSKVLA
jgi:hypothetical protein